MCIRDRVGHEWDGTAQRDSYWVSYGGKCFLVAGTHMRHAEFEESLSQEAFVKELNKVFEELQTPTMQYTDMRKEQLDPDTVLEQSISGRTDPMASNDGHHPSVTSGHHPEEASGGGLFSRLAATAGPDLSLIHISEPTRPY